MKYRYDLEDGNWVIIERSSKDDDLDCKTSWGSTVGFTIKESDLDSFVDKWIEYARENKAAMLIFENRLKELGFKRIE